MKIRIDGSACYVDDEPDENGVHHGEWKHSELPVSVVWNDEDNKWEERQVMQDDPVAEEFKRRFRHYDGYRSQVAQQDLLRVFRSGVQWAESRQAEAAERALQIVESVCMNTDGDYLEGESEIPVGEVLRMIANARAGARSKNDD